MCHFVFNLASSLKKDTLVMLQSSHRSKTMLHSGDLAVVKSNFDFKRPQLI